MGGSAGCVHLSRFAIAKLADGAQKAMSSRRIRKAGGEHEQHAGSCRIASCWLAQSSAWLQVPCCPVSGCCTYHSSRHPTLSGCPCLPCTSTVSVCQRRTVEPRLTYIVS